MAIPDPGLSHRHWTVTHDGWREAALHHAYWDYVDWEQWGKPPMENTYIRGYDRYFGTPWPGEADYEEYRDSDDSDDSEGGDADE